MQPPIKELEKIGEWQSFNPTLNRVKEGLVRLNHPHRNWPHFLIGGTNGKGTVSFNLAHSLGRKTGLFTSPHLLDVRERISLSGEQLSDEAWQQARRRILKAWPKPNLSYFEWLLLLAVVMFDQAKVENAVFEVGMGGRLDATNALSPLMSVLTQVSLDHQQYLGDSCAKIAMEKIEIARSDQPFFFPAAILKYAGVKRRLKALGCQQVPIALPEGFEANKVLLNQVLQRLQLPQKKSLLLLPGRREHLPEAKGIYLDGAHNQAGWRDLKMWIQSLNLGPITVLCSLSTGRDPKTFLNELQGIAQSFVHWPAGFEKELPVQSWPKEVTIISIKELPRLLEKPLLVCGSLYFIGEFRRWLSSYLGYSPANNS